MRIHHSRPGAHFTQIPNDMLRDDRLSYAARGILCELLSRPDDWEATADKTAERARGERGKPGEGRRPIRAAFAELKAAGYMITVKVPLPGGKWGTEVHVYDRPQTDVPDAGTSVSPADMQVSAGGTGIPHPGTPEQATDVPDAGTSVSPAETGVRPARTDVPPTDVPHAGTSLRTLSTNTVKNTPARLRADEDDDPAFGEFWGVYPLKKDKRAARRAWQAALSRGADPAVITAAAKRYADDPARRSAYTKYPATWLNAGSYADEEPGPEPEREYTGWMG